MARVVESKEEALKYASAQMARNWIDATKNLPPENLLVLAWCEHYCKWLLAHYFCGHWAMAYDCTVEPCGITHWMPLPNPPGQKE